MCIRDSFAPYYALRPMLDPNGEVMPPKGMLNIVTVGDMNVPLNSGIAIGRAAGAVPFLRPDAADRYPAYVDYVTPSALFAALDGVTPNRALIDAHVIEGVSRLAREAPADLTSCRPNELPVTVQDVVCHPNCTETDTKSCLGGQTCVSGRCVGKPISEDDCAQSLYDIDVLDEGLSLYGEREATVPLLNGIMKRVRDEYPDIDDHYFICEIVREMIGAMVMDVLNETKARLSVLNPETPDDIRAADRPMVAFSEGMFVQVEQLRAFLPTMPIVRALGLRFVRIEPGELAGRGKGLVEYGAQTNFPNPWPGGTWRLRDIMDYERIASDAILEYCANHRRDVLSNMLARARASVAAAAPGEAYRIPMGQRDPATARAPVSYTHLRAHETVLDLVCRLLLDNKKRRQHHSPVEPLFKHRSVQPSEAKPARHHPQPDLTLERYHPTLSHKRRLDTTFSSYVNAGT